MSFIYDLFTQVSDTGPHGLLVWLPVGTPGGQTFQHKDFLHYPSVLFWNNVSAYAPVSSTSYFKSFKPDFTSKLVHWIAVGTPKFYVAPYDKINHGLVKLSCNCDVKSGLRCKKKKYQKITHLPTSFHWFAIRIVCKDSKCNCALLHVAAKLLGFRGRGFAPQALFISFTAL